MASTYSDRLRFEKQGVGENANTWGSILNTNVIELIDEAIGGYVVVSVSSAPVTLSSNNGATDQARQASLEFAGTLTADVTITIPQEEKTYFLRNSTTGSFAVTMKTAAGTAVTVPQSSNVFVACDGTEIYKIETATSVASFTANNLTVVSTASVTEIDASIGSFSGPVSITGALNVVGFVSGTNAVFTSTVSASNIFATSVEASVGKFTNITVSGAITANTSIQSSVGFFLNGYSIGGVAQIVSDIDTLVATGTTIIPDDNTVPLITEGDEYLKVSVTPKAASNKLRIDVILQASQNVGHCIGALFKDSETSAIAAAFGRTDNSFAWMPLTFSHIMTAGTVTSITFAVRAGPGSAGTFTLNGYATGQKLGGVLASSIIVTEYI